jgi:cytochrome P450
MIDERRRSSEAQDDFLSVLLRARDEAGNAMSDDQVRDEALTLFVAGHETTATALSWCVYLLSQHPDVYAKAKEEVDSVLQGRSPTYADLPRLPYTLQVTKETMRLYPPGWLLNRRALRSLEIGGYAVQKGQPVMVSAYTIHRRPDYFPDPEWFDPDRFLPENEKRLPRHAYMPFGAGPRICIGNHFALMEAHLILATLLQRVGFTLVPCQQIAPVGYMTLRQKSGCKVMVWQRDKRIGVWDSR